MAGAPLAFWDSFPGQGAAAVVLRRCCSQSSLVILSAKAKGNKNNNARVLRAVEFRPPSGAINKAVLSPVRIESPF